LTQQLTRNFELELAAHIISNFLSTFQAMSEHPLLFHRRMQGSPVDQVRMGSIMLKVRMSDLAAGATVRDFVLFIADKFLVRGFFDLRWIQTDTLPSDYASFELIVPPYETSKGHGKGSGGSGDQGGAAGKAKAKGKAAAKPKAKIQGKAAAKPKAKAKSKAVAKPKAKAKGKAAAKAKVGKGQGNVGKGQGKVGEGQGKIGPSVVFPAGYAGDIPCTPSFGAVD
jgi:hypothetical protein